MRGGDAIGDRPIGADAGIDALERLVRDANGADANADGILARADALFGDAARGVLIERDGRIVYANPRAAEILGRRDREALLGTIALELYSDASLPAVLARIQCAYFGKLAQPGRHDVLRPDGGRKRVEATCLLLRLYGAPVLVEILREAEDGEPSGPR
jgi:PAS domain S-box-containing protein